MARILIVDDNSDIAMLLSIVLESAGHAPVRAGGGSEALAVIASDADLDLVILDVQMADMDGWETLEKIRDTEHTANLPVVMCSVKASDRDLVHGWQLGCDGYLTKPFDIQTILDEVGAVLERPAEERIRRRERAIASTESIHSNM